VEDHDLETAGLDSESGLKMGDLLDQKLPQPLLRPEMLRAIPPSFFEKISYLALIMGESRDSGQNQG